MTKRRFRFSDTFVGYLLAEIARKPLILGLVGLFVGAVIAVLFLD